MDKGTLIRTILLLVAFINQLLAVSGKELIPVTEDDLNNVYLLVSTVITFAVSMWTWWKNNYVSKKGQAQKKVLEKHNLD